MFVLALNLWENKIQVVENGINIVHYTYKGMLEKLEQMSEFERHVYIKQVNQTSGEEVINYKLLKQMCEQDELGEGLFTSEAQKPKNKEVEDFSRDYAKAYMKMLSQ